MKIMCIINFKILKFSKKCTNSKNLWVYLDRGIQGGFGGRVKEGRERKGEGGVVQVMDIVGNLDPQVQIYY